uniref:SecY-interacting protein n=1 Tax=Ningiella ruwaisensis TaxID=2364274 RepID=UPI0010A04D06|nr:SecY-interacting protein [Ningiella ruwaisensis]
MTQIEQSDRLSDFKHHFEKFVQSYIEQSNKDNKGLITEFDPEWPSPCLQIDESLSAGASAGENIAWKPYKRTPPGDLHNLESALEISIDTRLGLLFGQYFGLDLHAEHERGPVLLLQAYSETDYERLQKNLIAHVLMKRRLKQADTLFFALTDEDDWIISLDVQSCAVVLEQVGKAPKEKIADSLTDFIAALTPVPQFVSL